MMTKQKPKAVKGGKQVPRKASFSAVNIESFHQRLLDRAADLVAAVASMRASGLESVVIDGAGMADRTMDNLSGFIVNLESAIRAASIRKTGFRG